MATLPANPSNLQAIANGAKPGDTVALATGIYENTYPGTDILRIRTSGMSGLPITFRPAKGGRPIFAVRDNWSGILVEADYIRLDGLALVGISREITYDDALEASQAPTEPRHNSNGITIRNTRNVTVQNCQVTDMPGGGIYAVGCDYLTIDRNIVSGCCYWSRYGQSGISVHKSVAVNDSTITKINVRGNASHGNENRIPWYRTGLIQDGHGILFDENEAYPAPMLGSGNQCFGNGGLGVHAYKSPTTVLKDNLERWNNRSNVTA